MRRLLSSEHFSIDGSLIQAWAIVKSFRPKDSDGAAPQRRNNATHGSTTDPDALLYRKGPTGGISLNLPAHP